MRWIFPPMLLMACTVTPDEAPKPPEKALPSIDHHHVIKPSNPTPKPKAPAAPVAEPKPKPVKPVCPVETGNEREKIIQLLECLKERKP